MFAFFKDELEARKSLKPLIRARIITKYSLKRFLSICGEKMSKGFLKICKLITNLILGQIIVSNLTNVRKQNSRDARDAAPERYQVTPVSLQTLQPSYALSKMKTKTMPSEIGFPTLTQPKTQ